MKILSIQMLRSYDNDIMIQFNSLHMFMDTIKKKRCIYIYIKEQFSCIDNHSIEIKKIVKYSLFLCNYSA